MTTSKRATRPPSTPIVDEFKKAGRQRRQILHDLQGQGAPPRPRNNLLPSIELVHRAPGELTVPARNVRRIDPTHLREIMASISALGFCDPVLIDGCNGVLDGAVRVEAARHLGLPAIPCIVVQHLTPQEQRLLRLAANRLQEKGGWDLDALKLEFDELLLDNAPVEFTGFTLAEIDQIVLEEPTPVEAGPLEPELGVPPLARIGDVFLLGSHRLVCGDATDPGVIATAVVGEKAALVLTDQPYNVPIAGHVTGGMHREFIMASGEMNVEAFAAFNSAWIGATLPMLRDGGVLGTFIDWRGYPAVVAAADGQGLVPLNLIVWTKTNAGMGSLYRSQHELLPLFKKGQAPHVNNVALGRGGRWRSNVWTYPGASSVGSDARRGLQDHPTVKPVALLSDALLDLTDRGDMVLDPFLGSGSTLVAAEQTGRRCCGVELDPCYVDLIVRRYSELTGRSAVLESTGETREELRKSRDPPRIKV
jgi:DNA modification methylase